jgi:hypothetical protein
VSTIPSLNKLMTVTTWLKRNTVVRITGLLLGEDWPTKKKTKPRPFREPELIATMDAAEGEERLLLRVFLGDRNEGG